MQGNLTLGRVLIGGVSASIILWLLMQYNTRYAWMYLFVILLGIVMVYRKMIFAQINGIIALFNKL